MSKHNSLKRGSASSFPGIITSCCPFLSSTDKESYGSPPYSRDLRIRIQNWSNSLTGSTGTSRGVPSTGELPGLSEFSDNIPSVSIQKSESLVYVSERDENVTVILPPRDGCSIEESPLASIDNSCQKILERDWQAEKGQEEEEVEVALVPINSFSDDGGDFTLLEPKEASTALELKRQLHSPVLYSPPENTPDAPSTSPTRVSVLAAVYEGKVLETTAPVLDQPQPRRMESSLEMFDALAYQWPQTPKEKSQHSSTSELLEIAARAEVETSQEILQNENLTVQDPHAIDDPPNNQESPSKTHSSHTSASSELLSAISNLHSTRGSKSRRSRRTTTRAPTPWSEANANDMADEEGDLERAPSSTGTSSYGSVEAVVDSTSFHTLPTPNSSAEQAGEQPDSPPAQDEIGGEAAGDQSPASAFPDDDDDFSLRYFCRGFQPDDHIMSRFTGIEEVDLTEITKSRPDIEPFHSESVVRKPPEDQKRSDGCSVSEIVLPVAMRTSSSGHLSTGSSGVLLEAKEPSTYLPL